MKRRKKLLDTKRHATSGIFPSGNRVLFTVSHAATINAAEDEMEVALNLMEETICGGLWF